MRGCRGSDGSFSLSPSFWAGRDGEESIWSVTFKAPLSEDAGNISIHDEGDLVLHDVGVFRALAADRRNDR